ncbi:CAP domain-containing protein [Pseudomonas sp. BIGb0427]|uniref:CAP domain-containing protein n=1 Tax=unclassified Pseudomonas TaxID=196821 RepID=UPI0018A6DEAB|nr:MULTISPECIES: CAP domain-containing protein [unclassified Pseudomonas]QPG61410.1 CAP domain-containing protein [Pseudomonas sp. BIGb0427]UVM68927.1 CAP domain-containing protein [Pseudomonas sp. B21-009]
MRVTSPVASLALLSLGLAFSVTAQASDESQLIESINAYRSQAQRCAGQGSMELPPLASDPRLMLPANRMGDLREALAQNSYPMVNVQAISLSGPRDAQAAMQAVRESFCQVVLDPQFVDVGVSREGRDWRIVLARPLLAGRLGDWQAEGQKVLEMINTARSQARQCGGQAFNATTALAWNTTLAGAAESHTRAMANNNFFDHKDRDGRTPGDRAELAGYAGQQVGENIAAGQDTPRKVVDGWLASPGHCANLMSPQFSELGAAYAVDPKSDAGIYWTAMFGAP